MDAVRDGGSRRNRLWELRGKKMADAQTVLLGVLWCICTYKMHTLINPTAVTSAADSLRYTQLKCEETVDLNDKEKEVKSLEIHPKICLIQDKHLYNKKRIKAANFCR